MILRTLQEAFRMGISYKTTVMLAAFVLFLSVTISSSKANNNDFVENLYVDGGNPTTIEEVPWQASLTWRGMSFCGGAIVSELIIVTSAYCLHDFNPIQVRTNATRLIVDGLLSDVKRTIEHELYSYRDFDYDIGIVELTEPLQFGPGTERILLPKQDYPIVEGEVVHVSGWGEFLPGELLPDVLHEEFIPVFNQQECETELEFMSFVTERMFCAGYMIGDSCIGDSGAPAVINGTLVGISPWYFGCGGLIGVPRVYTKIAVFRNWLAVNALL